MPSSKARTPASRAIHALPVSDRVRELLAALSLNRSQLAGVVGVSRPTLDEWLVGKEPSGFDTSRMTTLLELAVSSGVTSASPTSPRFICHSMYEGAPSLLELLHAASIDESQVSSLMREAKFREDEAMARRVSREERLRALGFVDPSDDQRREQLAFNVARRDWPRD